MSHFISKEWLFVQFFAAESTLLKAKGAAVAAPLVGFAIVGLLPAAPNIEIRSFV